MTSLCAEQGEQYLSKAPVPHHSTFSVPRGLGTYLGMAYLGTPSWYSGGSKA